MSKSCISFIFETILWIFVSQRDTFYSWGLQAGKVLTIEIIPRTCINLQSTISFSTLIQRYTSEELYSQMSHCLRCLYPSLLIRDQAHHHSDENLHPITHTNLIESWDTPECLNMYAAYSRQYKCSAEKQNAEDDTDSVHRSNYRINESINLAWAMSKVQYRRLALRSVYCKQLLYLSMPKNRPISSLVAIFLLALLSRTVFCELTNDTDILWPKPLSFSWDSSNDTITLNPCNINYIFNTDIYAARAILQLYLLEAFKCVQTEKATISLTISIANSNQTIPPMNASHEEYKLTMGTSGKWELFSNYYPGFLRGFETFSQLFLRNKAEKQWQIRGIPISVQDSPQFSWRGLMIDSSRHYLSVDLIKRTLMGMLFNKLNVLHWHIIDQDSFPYQIDSLPQLSQSGKVGGVYSRNDIQEVIKQAAEFGIRVVPEIDTPAHTHSWGRSSKYSKIALNCDQAYDGQLDPTLPLTWEVVQGVMKNTKDLFIDQYVHFGGDEVEQDCWDQRPQIKEFMKRQGIPSYKDLEVWYRKRQKQLWRNMTSERKVIYWANEQIDLPADEEDTIQWWGFSDSIDALKDHKNPIILSNYDQTYLDVGFGDPFGDPYFEYQTWRDVYGFEPNIEGVNVIGGEVAMWGELANHAEVSERLWNSKIDISGDIRNIVVRLTAHSKRMKQRGFKMWPVTVQLCQKDASLCF